MATYIDLCNDATFDAVYDALQLVFGISKDVLDFAFGIYGCNEETLENILYYYGIDEEELLRVAGIDTEEEEEEE